MLVLQEFDWLVLEEPLSTCFQLLLQNSDSNMGRVLHGILPTGSRRIAHFWGFMDSKELTLSNCSRLSHVKPKLYYPEHLNRPSLLAMADSPLALARSVGRPMVSAGIS